MLPVAVVVLLLLVAVVVCGRLLLGWALDRRDDRARRQMYRTYHRHHV